MGAYQNAGKLLPCDVYTMAKRYGYSEDNLLILAGKEHALQEQYPQTYQNLQSCCHHRDQRSPMEYARDLVASWVVEDYFIQLLRNAGCGISAAGADCDRTLLPNTSVRAASDFQVNWNGQTFQVEFMCDYGGYWQRTHQLDLRDHKFQTLCREKSILLGVDAQRHLAILIDFRKAAPPAEYISCHPPYGGKPAYRIPCPESGFFPLTPEELARRLQLAST